MSASVAGRLAARSRLDRVPSRRPPMVLRRPPGGQSRLPLAIGISAIAHVLILGAGVGLLMWTTANQPKLYVVNLVPAVAAVGVPTAPAGPAVPSRAPAPAPPTRVPVPEPPRREPVTQAPARLPSPTFSSPRLPPRPAATLPRPGEKELPRLASPRVASAPPTTRAEQPAKPVDTPPAPSASLGQPTGSAAGVGALTVSASDFPYAWYLRQITQKIQIEWQRQNRTREPDHKPIVFFEIQRDGSIRGPKVEQSSGNTVYDQAALRSVVDASPFPPLPQDWSRPSLRVMMRFDLTPSGG